MIFIGLGFWFSLKVVGHIFKVRCIINDIVIKYNVKLRTFGTFVLFYALYLYYILSVADKFFIG